MSEYPRDVPRLRTIERYLLVQLAAVQRAIERAENGTPEPSLPRADWSIQWRRARVGEIRVGILHRADCMLATGEPLDARAVQAQRRREGRRVEPCDACSPKLP